MPDARRRMGTWRSYSVLLNPASGRRTAEPGDFAISVGGGQAGAATATLHIGGAVKELH